MPSAFNVTTPTNDLKLPDSRQGVVALTVSNISGKSQQGRLSLVPLPQGVLRYLYRMRLLGTPAQADWLKVEGEATRSFPAGGTEQYRVAIAVPKEAPEGRYTYRPDVVAVANPDEDSTIGPTLAFEVPRPLPPPPPQPFPWWIVAAAAAALVVIGVLVYLFILSVIVPDVVNQDVAAAQTTLSGAGLRAGTPTPATTLRVPSGIVLTQVPAGGSRVARNSTVDLVVEHNVVVPNVLGFLFVVAQQTLVQAGLNAIEFNCFGAGGVGTVVSETPLPNTPVAPGTTVQLTCIPIFPGAAPTQIPLITPRPTGAASP